ncbi:MAG: glycosyl hydrolase family 95 catalytic domain-containing protein [Armatimonadota bacterium]
MNSSPASLEQVLRFALDRAGYLRQFDPIFRRPIVEGWNALPAGNGELTAVVWQPGHLTWMLNTNDIDLAVSQMARVVIETPAPLAERLGILESRLSLAEATVTVDYTGGTAPRDAAGIWPRRAQGYAELHDKFGANAQPRSAFEPGEVDQGAVHVETYIPDGRNVLLVDYRSEAPLAQPVTIVLERWVQEQWGDDLHAAVEDGLLTLVYRTVTGVSYAVALAHEGFDGATAGVETPVRATLTLPPATKVNGRLAVAVVTSREAKDPFAAAKALAVEALREETWREEHLAYWREFWGAFFVDAGHPYLNALYHMALYELGVTSRGKSPVKFNGALNLWHEFPRDWGGKYWCHNQSEALLPVYAPNHAELADPLHEWIARMLPRARGAALAYYGVQGAFYHEVMEEDYRVKEEDHPDNWEISRILSSGTRYALLLWDRYRYTLDEAFLREKAYPVIRACAEFYQHYAKLGEDGHYHIGPAMAWEMRPVGTDTHPDCAAWRVIFSTVIEAAEILGIAAADIVVWRDLLAKAPPYPTDGEVFTQVINDEGKPEPANYWTWQLPMLSSVFPFGTIGISAPAELKRLAENTFRRYRFTPDAGHEFLPVVAARLGDAETWRAAMYLYIQFFQSFDQGLFEYFNINGNRNKDRGQYTGLIPYLEGTGIMAAATNEMLLQSYDGVIRVFPAIPDFWQGRFMLKATGAFLVASEHRGDAGIPYIAIQPVGGTPRMCRVALPWATGAELVVIENPEKRGQTPISGKSSSEKKGQTPISEKASEIRVSPHFSEGRAEFQAQPGQIYVLLPKGQQLEDIPAVEVTFEKQYSPCRLGQANFGQPDTAFGHQEGFPLW